MRRLPWDLNLVLTVLGVSVAGAALVALTGSPIGGTGPGPGEPPALSAPYPQAVLSSSPLRLRAADDDTTEAVTSTATQPTRLRVGAGSGIDAPVVPIDVVGSVLTPPSDPQVIGWWGKEAGSRHGSTLLVGHSAHAGAAALNDLEFVPVGAPVDVSGVAYSVVSVETMSKPELAERAQGLFAQDGPARLVIVTCEDYDYATGEWESNTVVIAEPAG